MAILIEKKPYLEKLGERLRQAMEV